MILSDMAPEIIKKQKELWNKKGDLKMPEEGEEKDGEKEMKKEQLKKEIFEKAHTEESSELARKYFELSGLEIKKVTIDQCEKLSDFITDEINKLLVDKSYSMVLRLRMHRRIRETRDGIYLLTDGSYFKKRQAISFNFRDKIIFCSWASGCNRIPYIKGFVKWCDSLRPQQGSI